MESIESATAVSWDMKGREKEKSLRGREEGGRKDDSNGEAGGG